MRRLLCFLAAAVPASAERQVFRPRASELDPRTRVHPEIGFVFEKDAKHKADTPVWYDSMNEAVVDGRADQGWLAGELGGNHFVRRLTLEQGARPRPKWPGPGSAS